MKKINQKLFLKNLILILLLIITIISIKFNIKIGIFVYPYLLYCITKKNDLVFSSFLNFLSGVLIFLILYSWKSLVGIELIILGALLTGLIFGLTGLISKYILTKIKNNLVIEILIYPSLLYLFKFILINPISKIKYFLDFPFVYGELFSIFGSSGVNYILFTVSIALGILISRKSWKKMLILITLILFTFTIFISINHFNSNEITEKVNIGIVQGNFNYSFDLRQKYALTKIYDYYENESIKLALNGTKLIVWPEYAIANDFSKNQTMINKLENLTKNYNFTLILGSFIDESKTVRKDISYVITPGGFLRNYESQILYKGLSDGWKLKEGNESILYKTNQGNFLILICYEGLFREMLWKYSMDEIDYIIIIANNQLINDKFIFNTLIWNMQDIASSREKYVISSTNTGPSTVIGPKGEILSKLPFNKKASLSYEIPIFKEKTNSFYSKYNEILIQAFILIFFSYLFYASIKNKRK